MSRAGGVSCAVRAPKYASSLSTLSIPSGTFGARGVKGANGKTAKMRMPRITANAISTYFGAFRTADFFLCPNWRHDIRRAIQRNRRPSSESPAGATDRFARSEAIHEAVNELAGW